MCVGLRQPEHILFAIAGALEPVNSNCIKSMLLIHLTYRHVRFDQSK